MSVDRDALRRTRSVLFDYWAGRLPAHRAQTVRRTLSLLRERMPEAHKALMYAHVDGLREFVDWRMEEEAVAAIASYLEEAKTIRRKAI